MVGWHHQLDGHEFEHALGVGDGQESLACYSPWGRKEWDMTEPLNCFTDTELLLLLLFFNQLKVSGNPPLIKSQGITFSTAFTSLHVSVSHFDSSCNISNFLLISVVIICFGDL